MSAVITASAVPELGVEVPVADVERELSRQLQAMCGLGEAPVQRVRMSNLVVYTNRPDAADALIPQMAEVVAVHPARVLLLVADAPVTGITAAARAWSRRLGGNEQVCSELVILRAQAGWAERLPFAVRSLVIGDLPINLWWSSTEPPALAGALLVDLAEDAQQIMYDSLGWLDPARGVAGTWDWIEAVERTEPGRWRVVSDLNWRRLKFWRRFLTQAFEGAEATGATDAIHEVLIEHGPHAVIQAWELAGWMARRMGWKVQAGRVQRGKEMAWKFHGARGDLTLRIHRLEAGPPEVRRVRIAGVLVDVPTALNLFVEDGRLCQTVEGTHTEPRTMTVPAPSAAEVVGRQLSDRERDPVFRDSMATAQVMARSLMG
jgi:glucose-6-phosphate dehydrogenase assembly protein OpcA